MDLTLVRRLIKLVNESHIHEVEIEQDGVRVRVTRSSPGSTTVAVPYDHHSAGPAVSAPVGAPAAAPPAGGAPAVEDARMHRVVSPIVGTFFRAPAPDAEPFVQVGQAITAGATLCIIEAMKIMNEIESDISGRIAKILVENGQPVEYNQILFLIDPA